MKTVNSFPLSHSAYTAESNDFRRGHRNEIYRDVPCVNIILRSDCTMKSTQYNCLQKNTDQSESKIVKQSKGDTETTLGISDFNLPQEKCEHIAVNTNESPNLLPISRVQCEGTSAQDRKAVTFTSIQTIPHTSSELPSYRSKYSNETSYFNQNPLDLVRKRLVYSEAEINTNKEEVEGPMRYKESIWKTYPVIKLENSTRKVYGDNVISTKKSISTFMEADEPVKHITVTKTVLTPTKQKSAKDCSCICSHAVPYSNQTLMKDKMVEGNIQLGLLRDYEKNDKKQEAPFDYDKNVSDITTSKKAGEKNANCGINATCDSMRYSTLNMEQKTEYESLTRDLKSKSNATVKFYHSTPERKLESPVSKNLLSEKDLNYCTDISCNAINNRTTGLIRDTKSVNTAVSVKSVGTITNNTLTAQKDLYYSKVKQEPKGTIDTTMNTLEGILTGIKSLNDKSITKHNAHSYQDGSIRCKDMDCNVTGMNNKLSTGCMKPECLRMLEEIKECTKMLEEQLTIMNKNMKTKRSRNSYGDKQRKDIITQKPEKENVCVQEPSLNNFKHIKHMQDLRMKPRNNLDVQQIELQDKTYQETGKKTAWTKETLQIPKYHGKQERSESSKKMLHKFESKNNSNMNQSSSLKGVRQREKDQWTKSYTIDFSNFEPLAASTFRDKDPSSGNRHVCPAIGQTSIVSNRNSERWQKKETRLTELIRHPSKRRERTISLGNVKGMQGCSSCPEKTIVMLLLTRGVHNSYLKSKYKRLEFMNFKPKCNNGDQILKRRKAQAPTVFRELKSVQCKIENCSNSAENAYGNFTDNPTVNSKVSNLWATVCTQSSNLYITTATSVSDVNFMNYSSNCIKAKPARSGTCILS
nr:uncharacterized protein LOC116429679 [Nomia melanderi]